MDFYELGKEILGCGNNLRFRAKGNSMYPFIKDADIVEIEPASKNFITIGDIVLYRRKNEQITVHRLIKRFNLNNRPLFLVKGDANTDKGECVLPEEVLGRVVIIERSGRRIKPNKFINFLCAKLSPFSGVIYYYIHLSKAIFIAGSCEKTKRFNFMAKSNLLITLISELENKKNPLLQKDIEWPILLQLAQQEGLEGLLCHKITKNFSREDFLYPQALRLIENRYYLNVSNNILKIRKYEELLEGWDRLGIKILLLKGLALLKTVYEDISERGFGDMDILVEQEDIQKIKEYLENNGYEPLNDTGERENCGFVNSIMFERREGEYRYFVHLHWDIINGSIPSLVRLNLKEVFNEAQPLNDYKNIFCLSTNHQLLHLCEHALKHSYDRLILLYDIDKLIRYYKENLDWNKLTSDVKEFNLARPVYYTLYFSKKILDSPIPDSVFFSLRPKRFTFLEQRFINSVLNGSRKAGISYAVYLAMNRTLFCKMRFIFKTFFPSKNVMGKLRNLEPMNINPCHYFVRLYRGFLYSLRVAQALII